MFEKIDHIAIHVQDLYKTIDFYKKIFGFSIMFENIIPTGHKVVYLKLGGTILEINEMYEGNIAGTHFCLYTNDFLNDYNYLIKNGVNLLQKIHGTNARIPSEIGWNRAVFLGLNGEQIEIRGK